MIMHLARYKLYKQDLLFYTFHIYTNLPYVVSSNTRRLLHSPKDDNVTNQMYIIRSPFLIALKFSIFKRYISHKVLHHNLMQQNHTE
jgi:hypothetical protein